jgi:hypothetical protein
VSGAINDNRVERRIGPKLELAIVTSPKHTHSLCLAAITSQGQLRTTRIM